MADTQLTALTAITSAASGDKFYIVDVSDTTDGASGSSRQITLGNLVTGIESLIDALGTVTITAATISTAAITSAIIGSASISSLTSAVVTALQINDTAADHQYILAVSELSADRTITLPLLTGSDTFVFANFIQTLTNKTLTSPVLTTPQINDTSADHQYIFAVSELAADRTVTLPLLTGDDTFTFAAFTQTLTNKRITKRVTSIVSNANPTVNTDNCDCVDITAQAAAIASMTTNLSGTPTNFQSLIVRIKDDGTARAITWGASFEARGVALPTTTVISKVLTVGFLYDTTTSKWGCVASVQEA